MKYYNYIHSVRSKEVLNLLTILHIFILKDPRARTRIELVTISTHRISYKNNEKII